MVRMHVQIVILLLGSVQRVHRMVLLVIPVKWASSWRIMSVVTAPNQSKNAITALRTETHAKSAALVTTSRQTPAQLAHP